MVIVIVALVVVIMVMVNKSPMKLTRGWPVAKSPIGDIWAGVSGPRRCILVALFQWLAFIWDLLLRKWCPNYLHNLWKMSKIGQNSMKKWTFFAIILPWMASYESERSFLVIFSARDDLVKVSWKLDARKCQNQLTPPHFDQLSERSQPLAHDDAVR